MPTPNRTSERVPDTGYPVNGGGNEDGGFSEDIPWSPAGGAHSPAHAASHPPPPAVQSAAAGSDAAPDSVLQVSDRRLSDDVRSRLLESGHVDSSDIAVHVVQGRVVLEGSVSELALKRAAEALVRQCPGVLAVENRLKVLPDELGIGG